MPVRALTNNTVETRKMTVHRLTFCLSVACGLWSAAAQAQSYSFTTLAGIAGYGAVDGAGSDARFNRPFGVAVDSAGIIYVADDYNRTIRKVTPGGVVSTLAGLAGAMGSLDGSGSGARFYIPSGVAVDGAGTVYVADYYAIRKVSSSGVVSTLAGLGGAAGSADGLGSSARFNGVRGVALDSAGNIYLADSENCTIRKITPAGLVSTLAGLAGSTGSADGVGSSARLNRPYGVAVDPAGNLYVADYGNAIIRKITPDGVVSTLAGSAQQCGVEDGAGSSARFVSPKAIALGPDGNLYVAEYGACTIRKITPEGVVTTMAGLGWSCGTADGVGSSARFFCPNGIGVGPSGNIYVTEDLNCTLRQITPAAEVTTLAGKAEGAYSGSEDGPAGSSRFSSPEGVALDGTGNVYVADTGNATIRKINSAGVVSTLAGNFLSPRSIAVDSLGIIYVADTWNFTIRKMTPDGVVSTFAGQAGISGSVDGLGTSARFVGPRGVAVDRAGTLHVSDGYTIRTISPGGVVCTVAGSATVRGSADGVGSSARFMTPSGVALDSAGNLYVAETLLCVIRKVTPEAVVSTLAGLAYSEGSADGLGSSARFNWPEGVAVDTAGNVYVADTRNNTIRRITPAGMVSTLAGVPGLTGAADGVGSGARFVYPWGIAVDMAGRLYVAEFYNHTIRLGQIVPPTLRFNVSANQLILCWPQTASNYVLETSTTLSPTAVWTPVGDPVGTWGDNFVLTNTSSVGARFYRLRVP